MSEPVDTSAEAVERLYTGNSAGSMEHRGFSTKGLREKFSYTVNPKDWVSAADYDRLQSALTAAQGALDAANQHVRILQVQQEEYGHERTTAQQRIAELEQLLKDKK